MPLTLPVHERIMAEIAGRILTCTAANGYEFEVTEVLRRRLGETSGYPGGTVELACDGFRRLDASDVGTHARVEWEMEVLVVAYVLAPQDASEPLETTISRAERDVLKAMAIGDRFDLADIVQLQSSDRFGPDSDESSAGTVLTFTVQFVANETDLAVGRS